MAGAQSGMSMRPLLYLVHRIPYPPNKGDKIRSFNLLKSLSKKYEVYLGAFVDNKEDWQYVSRLNKYCKQIKLQPMNPRMARIKSLKAFVTGEALSLQYYKDGGLQKWVDETIKKHNVQHALVFSSTMAQYVTGRGKDSIKKRIADFVDIDSDKWRQYSLGVKPPMSWIYTREAERLLEYERKIANIFDATLFVSEAEMMDFNKLSPESVSRHGFYNNGVDTDYFDPQIPHLNPFEPGIKSIVFTGAMDYWANVDSVKWFANEVFHNIKKDCENVCFYIVGSNPTEEVRALQNIPGITVTGSVEDIRPYICHANIIVAPLRIARGVQNKVLEAMSMSRPIVASTPALEGIAKCDSYKPFCADTASEYLEKCVNILNNDSVQKESNNARMCILEKYNWDNNLKLVLDCMR